jgi:hypothetical protein
VPKCGKESVSPRRELLTAIGLIDFGREAIGSKLIPQCRNFKKPDSMDFMAPPVSVSGVAKDLYVSNEVPLPLVLCGLDQYGPIVVRTPSPAGQRGFAQSNHVEDEHAYWR